MKRVKNILIGIVGATLLTGTTLVSCSDYLDINDNPNYPKESLLNTLLPSTCATTVAQFGLNGTLIGNLWLQQVTQGNSTNQYNTITNYNLSASFTRGNDIWINAYANTLTDLKLIQEIAEEKKAWNYWLISKVLTAYNFHILTDMYEDIPFKEALDVEKYPHPKFDDSKSVVYPGILALLDEAIAKEAEAKASSNPVLTSQDLFFKGDVGRWVEFAKSLKLKVLMRDFEANKTQISTLLSQGGFLEVNCAVTVFEDAVDKGNPLYEYNIRQLNTTENLRACHTFLEFLLANNDPRIQCIYEVKKSVGKLGTLPYREAFEGLPFGTKPPTSGGNGVPLVNSSRFKQKYNDPVYLMNDAEIALLIAETYARLGDKANAEKFYKTGVTRAFDRWEETKGQADGFIKSGGTYAFDSSSLASMLKCIMIQKWVSYAGANTLDGVFDRNRTGIPAIDSQRTVRVSNTKEGLTPGYELGTFVVPGSSVLQAHEYPRRLLIPDKSALYNTNAPKTKAMTERMWWQIEDGK